MKHNQSGHLAALCFWHCFRRQALWLLLPLLLLPLQLVRNPLSASNLVERNNLDESSIPVARPLLPVGPLAHRPAESSYLRDTGRIELQGQQHQGWPPGAVPALSPAQQPPPLGFSDKVPTPQFAACDLPGPCGPPELKTSFYLLDLLRGLEGPAKAAIARGVSPALLQIGSADLSSSARFADIDLWNKTLRLLPEAVRERILLVFVDPNPEYEPAVLWRAGHLPIRTSQLRFVNAMVTDACASEHITMFNFSQQAVRDFGVSSGVLRSWIGPTRRYPLDVLAGYSGTAGMETRWRDKWLAFNRSANRSQYVQEVSVPCLTPASLLGIVGVAARDLVMVVIDAEQVDVRIVSAMLDLQNFLPWFLQFELANWGRAGFRDMEEFEEVVALLRKLQSHGLEVGKTFGNGRGGSDADNCIALPPGNWPPQFSACDLPLPCGPEGSRWNYLGDLMRVNVLPKVQEVVGRGELPVLLQIGSNDLGDGARFTDMDLYMKILPMIPPALRQQLRLVFVDANPEYEKPVLARMQQLPIQPSQARFVNGMVTDKCSSEFASMYRFGHKATEDFGVPWNVLRSWLGPTRSFPNQVLRTWASKVAPTLAAAQAAAWKAFFNAGNSSAYIVEVQVPCLSIDRLLRKADITAGRMAAAFIDAEQQDWRIVSALLDWERWRPGYLQYELTGAVWADERKNVQKLQSVGYEVGTTFGASQSGSDANNIIAVLSQVPVSP